VFKREMSDLDTICSCRPEVSMSIRQHIVVVASVAIIAGWAFPNAGVGAAAKEDMPNFHEVHPYLYRGGEPTDAGLKKAQEMGVKTVIDLRGTGPVTESEKKFVETQGMHYINLPMDSRAPSKKAVSTFMNEVKKAKSAPDGKSAVFVHCQHGSDRTGCMVGVWRVAQEGWTYDDAYKEMRKYYFSPKFINLSNTVRKYSAK
jgi:tyrosine-protein phosphatase SIW14